MGFAREYFRQGKDDPAPLVAVARRRVRFEEVDALGMVWHGRYASYFEDGRMAFGDSYGLTYHTFRENRTVAPVVQMHLDYKLPLRFDDTITIETALHWAESARLNFSYTIYNPRNEISACGYTVQLLTDPAGVVQLVVPAWLHDFQQKWGKGFLQKQCEK